MRFKKFQGRTAGRDIQTDEQRRHQVLDALRSVLKEIEQERVGLRKRYEASGVQASFVAVALEDGASDRTDDRLKSLEQAMLYCEKRTQILERQAAQVSDLLGLAERAFAMPD